MAKQKFVLMCCIWTTLLTLGTMIFVTPLHAEAKQQWQQSSIFPRLTGRYQVGKVDYDLVDTSRKEIFVDDPQAKREILVSIYYPADPLVGAQPSPFIKGKTLETFSQEYGVSSTFITDNIHSHAFVNAPLSKGQECYPVLIFSPGWGVNPLFYTPTLEDLASHGYIVAAIWPTYSSDFTVFPDGRVILANKAGSDPDHYPDEQNQYYAIRERVGGVWIADARFVLDELTQFNRYDKHFAQHIDLNDVGMFGHSFGGTVSLAVAAEDPRFKAASDVDGSLSIGPTDPHGLNKPMLLMRSDNPQYTDAQLQQMGLTRQQYEEALAQLDTEYHTYFDHSHPGYYFQLKNSAHGTYESLAALVAPLLPNQLPTDVVGTINGQRAVFVYDTYLEAFFGKYLQHQEEPLLCGPSFHFPEVHFEMHH